MVIIEGLKLMLIGMGIVYIYLVLLMILIIVSAKMFKHRVDLQKISGVRDKGLQEVIPVISAAIAVYKSRRKH
ncbi:MAG: hypothetical protein ACE5H1_00500 [Thermodesulfobacteriota bacterium]